MDELDVPPVLSCCLITYSSCGPALSLQARQEPEAAREGMGGTYFFPNEAGRKVGIFKPCDEEPLAPANPKGYVGRALGDPGWKSTVRVGEAAMREVAAYLLDHGHSAGVPHTVLVRAAHPLFNYTYHGGAAPAPAAEPGVPAGPARPLKLGSLQEFVHHLADTNEMGSGRFCTRDVHAIGILDLRLFNTDRHAGNILVRAPASATPASGGSSTAVVVPGVAAAAAVSRGGYRLVPIDHGFCLPEALEAPYFEWLHWPQACLPFDAHELDYIERLDARADVALLQRVRRRRLRMIVTDVNKSTLLHACGVHVACVNPCLAADHGPPSYRCHHPLCHSPRPPLSLCLLCCRSCPTCGQSVSVCWRCQQRCCSAARLQD